MKLTSSIAVALALAALPVAAHADVSIAENDKELVHECTGDDTIAVSGNKNRLVLTGTCKLVLLSGNDNTVKATTVVNVGVEGNNNQVAVDRTDRVYTPGNDNSVEYRRAFTPKKSTVVGNPGNRNRIRKKK